MKRQAFRFLLGLLAVLVAGAAQAGPTDHFVFDSEALALAGQQSITDRGRALLLTLGYAVDAEGDIIGKRNGALDPDAQHTERWAVPRQRLDGKWVIPHPACLSVAAQIFPAAGGLTVAQYMTQDVTAPLEVYDPAWFAAAPHY